MPVGELLQWDRWSSASREFLREQDEDIALRPLIDRHGVIVRELNVWLLRELSAAQDLTEVNHLIAQWNALLAGVDLETAKRITERSPYVASREPSDPTVSTGAGPDTIGCESD